eukprot:GHVU01042643.1.p1 GENE.GHVU01042643.1~~GHVU01042643.1.p1  ORF type:complete len:114 (+),score=10.94 GHVU01042643.1:373-714(+)
MASSCSRTLRELVLHGEAWQDVAGFQFEALEKLALFGPGGSEWFSRISESLSSMIVVLRIVDENEGGYLRRAPGHFARLRLPGLYGGDGRWTGDASTFIDYTPDCEIEDGWDG